MKNISMAIFIITVLISSGVVDLKSSAVGTNNVQTTSSKGDVAT